MSSTAEDIKSMLEYYDSGDSSSSGGVALYPIFIGKEPALPANCITIFETGIMPPQLTYNREEVYEKPTIQIRVRSTNYVEGWAVISYIKNTLHGRGGETWGDFVYTLIRCSNGPALLDYDKNQMVRFIINFYCQRR